LSATNPNPDALALITRSQRALYGYIYSLVGSRDQADEILQETNLVLCRKIGEFDGRVQFTTWACRIAYFEVLAGRKRLSRERLTFLDQSLLDAVAGHAEQIAAQESEMLPLLRECMGELPARSRQMVEQRYTGGGTVQTLSETLGRSSGSIRVALHRIRTTLLECIQRKASTAT
jgi:RNA polymerase sigma-70 factor (ECF subfamily)